MSLFILRIPYPESDAKNLIVRDDKKENYYLITVRGNKRVNLKEFRKENNTRPLSFASEKELKEIIQILPGSVSPLGILNDTENKVKVFIDKEFVEKTDIIGIHPNDNTEKSKIEAIYKSIPNQLGNVSNKFQYSKISSNARSRDYETSLQWLLSSTMIYKCNLLKTVQIPPKAYADEEYFKLYISDVGLLTSLLEIKFNDILLDNDFLYKGNIAENYIAQTLVKNGVSLYYWKSNSDAEVDFILYNKDGLIPIEDGGSCCQ